tara:strand:- start:1510 stop:1788 length:279 start_codon:yes stop_codon:yes gene_type:complete
MQNPIYMAYVEIDTEYGPKGHSLKYSTIKELTEEIVERYSNYHIHYAYKCQQPEKFDDQKNQWYFEKSKRITDIIRETVKIKRLNKGGQNVN